MNAEGRRGGGGGGGEAGQSIVAKESGEDSQTWHTGSRTRTTDERMHAYFAFKLNLLRDSLTYKLQLQLNQKDTACLGLMIKRRKIQFPFAFLAIVT